MLGVDVGFSLRRRSSAVCRLDWTADTLSWELARFTYREPDATDTLRRLAERPLLAAAFDGPLRRGFDEIGRYRSAERLLTVGFGPLIGKPGAANAPIGRRLNAAANHYARTVAATGQVAAARHGEAIDDLALVEAFPTAYLGCMIGSPATLGARRADRSDRFYRHLADGGVLDGLAGHLLPHRHLVTSFADVTNHDDRAAVVCALTALGVAAGDYVAVGDDDGWIILPPPIFIEGWAHALLNAGAAAGDMRRTTRSAPDISTP